MSLKLIEKLSEKDKKSLEKGVIEVQGKAMNRTALGIVDAMVQLYPNASFEELKSMMPDSINPSAPVNYKSLFKPYSDRPYGVIQPGSIRKECSDNYLDINASHFIKTEETFKSKDGIEILVSKSWESKDTETGEKDLQNLIDHVAKFGVRVTEYSDSKAFGKGGYKLEIVNPALKEKLANPPSKKWIWWLLLALSISAAVVWYLLK